VGQAANGVIITTVAYNPKSAQENIQKFINNYKTEYGIAPNSYAAHGYDALMILAKSIMEVGYNSERIRDYLYNVKDYDGVAGNTTFDENGDVIKPPRIMIIIEEQFTEYE
ncbi:unnamed protein product, partial [marine sediment metagenome]